MQQGRRQEERRVQEEVGGKRGSSPRTHPSECSKPRPVLDMPVMLRAVCRHQVNEVSVAEMQSPETTAGKLCCDDHCTDAAVEADAVDLPTGGRLGD